MKTTGRRLALLLVVLLGLLNVTVWAEVPDGDFAAQIEADFAEPEIRYRLNARWWLAEGSPTDETLIESIHELYIIKEIYFSLKV